MSLQIIHGDCRAVMAAMPADSVDAIVTDPPYGLSDEPDVAEVLRHWLAGDDYAHGSSGFMGQAWDSFVPGPAVWREAVRVLKPGGFCLSFFGGRTYDLGAIAMRLAGFEVRDLMAWLYGSGFPKSMDIGKAFDKPAGAEREVIGRKSDPRYQYGFDGNASSPMGNVDPRRARADHALVTAPTTDLARQWDGWGTALKPALEPIVLARKPLSERTVAANVARWGVGALNICACRVATDAPRPAIISKPKGGAFAGVFREGSSQGEDTSLGRWPPNVLHDGSQAVLDLFPNSEVAGNKNPSRQTIGYGSTSDRKAEPINHRDSGSAARFYPSFPPDEAPARYCPKAASKARVSRCTSCGYRLMGKAPDACPSCGATGQGTWAAHPTVKPVALMQWLCRLVTPPGANSVVLDPFAGTGTTLAAARAEGFSAVGIEMGAEFVGDIHHRLGMPMLQAAE